MNVSIRADASELLEASWSSQCCCARVVSIRADASELLEESRIIALRDSLKTTEFQFALMRVSSSRLWRESSSCGASASFNSR